MLHIEINNNINSRTAAGNNRGRFTYKIFKKKNPKKKKKKKKKVINETSQGK